MRGVYPNKEPHFTPNQQLALKAECKRQIELVKRSGILEGKGEGVVHIFNFDDVVFVPEEN